MYSSSLQKILAYGFIAILLLFLLTPIAILVSSSLYEQDAFDVDKRHWNPISWNILFGKSTYSKTADYVYFSGADEAAKGLYSLPLRLNIDASGLITADPVEPWVIEYAPIRVRVFTSTIYKDQRAPHRSEMVELIFEGEYSEGNTLSLHEKTYHKVPFPDWGDNVNRVLVHYEQIVFDPSIRQTIFKNLRNSVVISVSAALIVLILSVGLAYSVVRLNIRFREFILSTVLLAQMFPSFLLLIAYSTMFYQLGHVFSWLGTDSVFSVFSIYMGSMTLSMFLVLGYFKQVDASMEEAAFLEGASKLTVLCRILIPMSLPVLVVAFMISFVYFYTEYNLSTAFNLPLLVSSMYEMEHLVLGENRWAVIKLISCMPVVAIFILLRKHLISGLASGY